MWRIYICLLILLARSSAIDLSARYPNSSLSDILHWGTYKPHLLHGITERSPSMSPLSFAMILDTPQNSLAKHSKIHFKSRVLDIQSRANDEIIVDYLYHNGYDFAQQQIRGVGIPYEIDNIFLKEEYTSTRQRWHSITDIQPAFDQSDEFTNIFYAVILENNHVRNDPRYLHYDPQSQLITIKNSTSKFSNGEEYLHFTIYENEEILLDPDSEVVETYFQIHSGQDRARLWNLNELAKNGFMFRPPRNYKTYQDNIDFLNSETCAVIFQFRFPLQRNITIHWVYDSSFSFIETLSFNHMVDVYHRKEYQFLKDMKETFFPDLDQIDSDQWHLSTSAVSNLLGGLAHYYGSLEIKGNSSQQPSLSFFTATPSRNSFPRGFLWDEGFHDLLVCRWSFHICLETLSSWFQSQFSYGWIPREQARGLEMQSLIPREFLTQNPIEGNPPTLMLAIDYLISISQEHQAIQNWIHDNYLKIKLWWRWFHDSHQISVKGTQEALELFRWYGKPHGKDFWFYGSGLDDYPRSDPGYTSKAHLDLHTWQIVFASSMSRIAQMIGNNHDSLFFYNLAQDLHLSMFVTFYDQTDNKFRDLTQNDLHCDNKFSSHLGYVNLFPLMFGLIPPDNLQALDGTLDLIDPDNTQGMYSEFGILSLSRGDSMYQENDHYWTGPVWVNCNFLVLRGLRLYYSHYERALMIFDKLRYNLVQNMQENFKATGYIWENFDEVTGQGQGNHPFTGWSTLIALVMSNETFTRASGLYQDNMWLYTSLKQKVGRKAVKCLETEKILTQTQTEVILSYEKQTNWLNFFVWGLLVDVGLTFCQSYSKHSNYLEFNLAWGLLMLFINIVASIEYNIFNNIKGGTVLLMLKRNYETSWNGLIGTALVLMLAVKSVGIAVDLYKNQRLTEKDKPRRLYLSKIHVIINYLILAGSKIYLLFEYNSNNTVGIYVSLMILFHLLLAPII